MQEGRRPKTHNEGNAKEMKVLGIKLGSLKGEESRASKVNCINHKVPDQ